MSMIETILEVMTGIFFLIGVCIWLYFLTYAVSLGWHKGKTKYPTVINNYTHPTPEDSK